MGGESASPCGGTPTPPGELDPPPSLGFPMEGPSPPHPPQPPPTEDWDSDGWVWVGGLAPGIAGEASAASGGAGSGDASPEPSRKAPRLTAGRPCVAESLGGFLSCTCDACGARRDALAASGAPLRAILAPAAAAVPTALLAPSGSPGGALPGAPAVAQAAGTTGAAQSAASGPVAGAQAAPSGGALPGTPCEAHGDGRTDAARDVLAGAEATAGRGSGSAAPVGQGGPEEVGSHPPPELPGEAGAQKVRRVERAIPSPMAAAVATMEARFGAEWKGDFHRLHHLSLADPLVYCRRCGHHCETRQHLIGLRSRCGGAPPKGSVYHSRLEKIAKGQHPTRKGRALAKAVPLPPGTGDDSAGKP